VTYYADLERYEYMPDTVPEGQVALTVGWLDAKHAFPTGTSAEDFVERLFERCKSDRHAQTRGYKDCALCWKDGIDEWPVVAEREGVTLNMGDAEVRVSDGETWLVAPNLIYHYVVKHNYLPPSRFVEAVMSGERIEQHWMSP
jgi:hypothetical protein